MGQLIKEFENGTFLEYDRGGFDDWCVYFTDTNGTRKPPRDVDYFKQLTELAEKYSVEKVYTDYVQVYNLTGKEVEQTALAEISRISVSYGRDALDVDVIFSILYMCANTYFDTICVHPLKSAYTLSKFAYR